MGILNNVFFICKTVIEIKTLPGVVTWEVITAK